MEMITWYNWNPTCYSCISEYREPETIKDCFKKDSCPYYIPPTIEQYPKAVIQEANNG